MRVVKLTDIRINGGTQCRVVLSQPKIYEYVERMKEGDEFPPIQTRFDGSTHWLSNGFHRYHAQKLLGLKEVNVNYKPGTQDDAFLDALVANEDNGLPLTHEDRENKVRMALAHHLTKDLSNYEIAKRCKVSQPFVAGIRDPEKKQKQQEARQKSAKKKVLEAEAGKQETTNPISSEKATLRESTEKIPANGQHPDDAELKASELALQADLDAMYKLLESDEPLKEAHEEIKRLNYLNAQQKIRIDGLMNERNEAVKMLKKLQKENERLKAKK